MLLGAVLVLPVSDGFESKGLSPIWWQTRILSTDFRLQSNIVRSGKQALEISLHEYDHDEQSPGDLPTERAELLEAKELNSREGRAYSYAFSLFLPESFPIVPTRLVLAQWKQRCEDPCKKDNPVIALRFQSGALFVTVQTGDEKRKIYSSKDSFLGKWHDFKFDIRFSRGSDGWIRARLDGRKIIDYAGANSYPAGYGYPQPSTYFFKMGLYRDRMKEPMTAYFDDYQKSALGP